METVSAVDLLPWEEDEFIDIDVSSATATFIPCTIPPCPSNSKDFEFQMFSAYYQSPEKQVSTTSPADELFYKGNLLPLLLPPRIQMVQKLLKRDDKFNESFTTAVTTTPFASCEASPSPSCHVSGQLDPRHYFTDGLPDSVNNSSSSNSSNSNIKKCSWAKKLKLMKMLEASKEYIKSLFSISRSSCTDVNGFSNKDRNTSNIKAEKGDECGDWRSFSAAIRRRTKTKFMTSSSSSSSKSSSFSSASSCEQVIKLKSSSSVGSDDVESSIYGAIAHCKKSQGKTVEVEVPAARMSVSDFELSFSADLKHL